MIRQYVVSKICNNKKEMSFLIAPSLKKKRCIENENEKPRNK